MRRSPFSLWIVLLFALAVPTLAEAQIYVDKDATGTGDGTSWADAYTDLQAAIDNATGESEIWIAEGVYTPDSEGDSFTITGDQDGIELYGGFDGTETSRDQRAPREHRTILSGDIAGDDTDPDGDGIIENAANIAGDENAHHVLLLDGTSGGTLTLSTVLDGFTVTAGDADGSFPEDIGGGLLCDGEGAGNECSPAIANVLFTGNRPSREGGAIYNNGFNDGAASPRIADAQFFGNTADNGGALVNKDSDGSASNPTITNTTFSNNTAADDGGAVYNAVASPTMINVGFVDNTAGASGGALRIFGGAPSITNAVFAGNAATFDGGAIDNEGVSFQSSSLTITNATFVDNSAGQEGGAIVNRGLVSRGPEPEPSPTKATLTNTILWGNSAATGAEMYGRGSTATQTLSHTIVQGGAGVIVDEDGASTTYLNESGTAVPFANSTNLDADPRRVDATNPADPDGVVATRDDGTAIEMGSPAIEGGFTETLPAEARTLFVAVTLTGEAAGEVTGYLADQSALALEGGAITEVNGNEQTGFSNLPLSEEDSALPVELARFDGKVTEGGVALSWKTTSEDNNAGFQVQRQSLQGSPGEWREVGFVEGAGTTFNPQTYRFTDADIPYVADSLTYRLKQVDVGGTATLTDPITIARGGPAGLELLGTAPNPASRRATVRYAVRGGAGT
jgi:predicted outer membrane repeat protein